MCSNVLLVMIMYPQKGRICKITTIESSMVVEGRTPTIFVDGEIIDEDISINEVMAIISAHTLLRFIRT